MEWFTVKAEVRPGKGSRACKHLREKGMIPAIVYGRKEPEETLLVSQKEFSGVLNKGARLINLAYSNKTEKVLIKDVQFDSIHDQFVHVDFNRIALDEMLTMEIDIILKGHPKGIVAGGVLEHNLHKITVKCLPTNIPAHIDIDVSELEMGALIRVKEIKLPDGVNAVTEPEVVVAGVHMPKVEEVVVAAPVAGTGPEVITAKKETEEGAVEGKEEKKSAAKDEKKPAVKDEKKPAVKEEKKPVAK
jgi:large subunit ribosomal protein L25